MNNKKTGLRAKELITLGIFTALMIIVIFAFAMLMSGIPIVSLFTSCAVSLVCGTVFMYIATKIQKFGAISIMGLLIGLFMFLAGHFWLSVIWLTFGSVLSDFICLKGRYINFKLNALAYSVFCVALTLSSYTPMLFFAENFAKTRTQMGMTEQYIQKTLELTHGPLIVIVFGLTILCAFVGALIGRGLLRKHFQRAGVL